MDLNQPLDRAIRRQALLTFVLFLGFFAVTVTSCKEAEDTERFLGPSPGDALLYISEDGHKMTKEGVGRASRSVTVEETLILPPEQVPQGFPSTTKRTYSLIAGECALSMSTTDGLSTLIDMCNQSWPVTVHLPPGDTGEASCGIVSRRIEALFGQQREVIHVNCQLSGDYSDKPMTYALAEGLGFIQVHDFIIKDVKPVSPQ